MTHFSSTTPLHLYFDMRLVRFPRRQLRAVFQNRFVSGFEKVTSGFPSKRAGSYGFV
jgi:hypothetical protein